MGKARRARVLAAHHGKCWYCRTKIAESEQFDIDHAVALALGGSEDDENLRPLHRECHRIKTFGATRDQKRYSDISEIAKVKRIAKKRAHPMRKPKGTGPKAKIQSRGFDKTRTKKLRSGEVLYRDDTTGKMK